MFNSKPRNPQEKYEAFLDAQDARQRAVWFRDLPGMLSTIVTAINQSKDALAHDETKSKNFEDRTATKLRGMYAEVSKIIKGSVKDYDTEQRSRAIIGNMISQINGWYRSTKVACGVRSKMDSKYYGKAAIAESYEVVVSNDFNITTNRSWQ